MEPCWVLSLYREEIVGGENFHCTQEEDTQGGFLPYSSFRRTRLLVQKNQEPGKLNHRLNSACSAKSSHSRTYLIKNCTAHTLSCPQVGWDSGSPKTGFKNLFSQLENNAPKPKDSVTRGLINRSLPLILECNYLVSVKVNFS